MVLAFFLRHLINLKASFVVFLFCSCFDLCCVVCEESLATKVDTLYFGLDRRVVLDKFLIDKFLHAGTTLLLLLLYYYLYDS